MKYDKSISDKKKVNPQRQRVEPEHLQVPKFVQTPPSQRPVTANSRERQVKMQANSRRHKRRRKRNYILYYIILIFLLSVTGITLSLTVFFNIENIIVTGTEGNISVAPVADNVVISSSKLKIGENMFRINTGKTASNVVSGNLTIDHAEIKRRLPNTLEIKVTMAKPKAEIFYDKKYYSLSESNKIIGVGEEPLDKTAYKVVGADLKDIKAGMKLTADNKNKIEIIDDVIVALRETDIPEITIFDVSQDMDIRLFYGDSFEIKVGGILELSYKLQWAVNIIDNKLTADNEMGIIDVSVDNGHYYFKHTDSIEKPILK